MSVEYMFATPIWKFKLENSESINKTLTRIAPDFDGGNYFTSDVPPILELKDFVEGKIIEVTKELGWDASNLNIQARQNVTMPGGCDTPHHHPTCYIVAVYYMKVPEKSGGIMFHDPRGSVIWRDKQANTGITYCDARPFHRIIPEPGTLLIFPGYLVHSVETNLSDDVRISVVCDIEEVKIK